jgi:hypothetical protein
MIDQKGRNTMNPRLLGPVVLLASLALGAPLAAQDPIPRQASPLVIKDSFSFVPGTWADYAIFDKVKNEASRMYISILNRDTVGGKAGIWMEIEAEMKDSPLVVTDVFVEETKAGPGEIYKAVIQVKGMSPFTIPKKYLEGQDQQVGNFEAAQIVKRLEQKKIVHQGKTIDAWIVEAQDKEGRKVAATVSLQVLPITVVSAETDDMRMTLNDWGVGAKTRIEGQPIGFTLWIMEQIVNGLGKKK